MILSRFLYYMKYGAGRNSHGIEPLRWAAMVRWYYARKRLKEPFSWD